MPPILSLSNSLVASRPALDTASPTPTSTAGAITGINIAVNQANTFIANFNVVDTSTGGKVLNASLQNGKTVSDGVLMNGSGTLSVTRAAQDGHSEVTSTMTCYIYFNTAVTSTTTSYHIAPTQNAGGLSYGNPSEFDLATDFAADISAQAPFSTITALFRVDTFSFNVTVDSVLHNCTTSNTVTSNSALILPA